MTRPPAKATPQRPKGRTAQQGAAAGDQPKPAQGGERIAKVIARAGRASRREAEAMITAGRVSVNGKRIDSPALNVTPADRISIDDQPLAAPDRTRLWLYHKPLGLVTTMRDEKDRPTVFAALPTDMPRVMSVGRLDLNSEGLLLLTNDGALKRRLELPETGWLRKYRVRVHGSPDDAMLAPLRDGITVEGENFQPMLVTIDRQQGANAWLTIGIREGRNREIRRALQAVGLSVNRLIRTGYGPFQLGTLAAGAVSEIRPSVLRDQLGIEMETEQPARGKAPRDTRRAAPTPSKGPERKQARTERRAESPDRGPRKTPPGKGTGRPPHPGAGPRRP